MHPYTGFLQAAQQRPDAIALEINDQHWTYTEMADQVGRTAALVDRALGGACAGQRVGVFASRSLTAYAGSLAVLAAGAAHVALNPAYPAERNATILRRAGIDVLVVGPEAIERVPELLRLSGRALTVIATGSSVEPGWTGVRAVLDANDHAQAQPLADRSDQQRPEDLAYLVFTSGSTGEPKGVAIEHGNLAAYMRNFRELAAPLPTDRVVTTYELTFDVALHDLLNAWWSGATLVVMPERAMLAPARFMLDRRISYWFSVASFAMILQRQGLLRPGLFPQLRVGLLCGEALPKATAMAWSQAAPNAVLYNVYGPTETTMELAFYRWQPGRSEQDCLRGVTPIGLPFADHAHLLQDDAGREVVGPGTGELLLQGPQVGPGYWNDEERNAQTFVTLPDRPGRWYRTGDRIERDALGQYHFVSRIDFMVKVRGNRIELGEVEHALREASGVDLVAAIPKPAVDGMCPGLVGFVCTESGTPGHQIRDRVIGLLPKYMVPDEVRVLPQMPMNANRKIDRHALGAMLTSS